MLGSRYRHTSTYEPPGHDRERPGRGKPRSKDPGGIDVLSEEDRVEHLQRDEKARGVNNDEERQITLSASRGSEG